MQRMSRRSEGARAGARLALAACGVAALCAVAVTRVWAGPAGTEGEDFIYLVERGDTLIGLADRYMTRLDGWRMLQQLNRVGDPYRLQPGTRLRIPLKYIAEQAGSARAVAVHGDVRADGAPLRAGTQLAEAARIETGVDGLVTIELSDRSRLTLPPSSAVQVRRLRAFAKTGLTDSMLEVGRGGAEAQVAPGGTGVGRFEMRTPMMVTGVRGTRYRVAADDAGNRSEVLQGIVGVAGIAGAGKVGKAGAAARVGAGYGVSASGGGKLAAPVPLPPPPQLGALPQPVLGATAPLQWQPVAGASGYRVVVSRDAEQTEWLSTQRVAGQQATLADLPEGVLYVGVSAIGAQHLTGPASVQRFVVRLTPPAPFMLRPGKDSSQYGQQVGFAWAHVDGGVRAYEYEVAGDSDFRDAAVQPLRSEQTEAGRELALGRWWWRVRSLDAAGQPGPWSESVPFTVEPPPPQPSLADDGGDTLRIRWPAAGAAAAAGYRVQLADEARFTHPLVDAHTGTNEVALPRPGSGFYYVRVAREGKGGGKAAVSEAAFSAPQRIEVVQYLRDGTGQPVASAGGMIRRGQ